MKKNINIISKILGGFELSDDRWVNHAAFDSRKVKEGTLFFAISGKKVDGHSFLEEVATKGAVGAVVSKEYRGEGYGLSLIYVDDVKTALHTLAKKCYQENPAYLIGVTGTVGKTTTKEFIATLLEEKYPVYKSPGSANSQVSFPLELLNRDETKSILVLEMGMSFPGELTKLIEIAPPTLGVMTKVSLVHTENFPDLEAIARAKGEMFQSDQTELAILNHQTSGFESIKKIRCPKCFYSIETHGVDYFLEREGNTLFLWEKGKKHPLQLPFEESHLCEDALAAIAVARHLKLSFEEIERGAKKLTPFLHRFQKIVKEGVLFIDDSYNASPEGMRAALRNLPKPEKGKKTIAVFGAMKELGAFSEKCHREIGEEALPYIDHLICYGNECASMITTFAEKKKPAELLGDLKEIKRRIANIVEKGDVVLLKGANSLRMWEILESLQ